MKKILLMSVVAFLLCGCGANPNASSNGGISSSSEGSSSSSSQQESKADKIWNDFVSKIDNYTIEASVKEKSLDNEYDYTYEATRNMSAVTDGFKFKETVSVDGTYQIPENKIKAYLSSYYEKEIDEEDLPQYIKWLSYNFTEFELVEGVYHFAKQYDDPVSYFDFHSDEDCLIDEYYYDDGEEKFEKHVTFKEGDFYAYADFYSQFKFAVNHKDSFTYDEENNCFIYDVSKYLEDEFPEEFGELTSYKYFVTDDVISSVEIISKCFEDVFFEQKVNGTFVFGNAKIDLPTNIIPCDHGYVDSHNGTYQGKHYHYNYCEDCDSILSCELCTFDETDHCTICDNCPTLYYYIAQEPGNDLYIEYTEFHHYIVQVDAFVDAEFQCHDWITGDDSKVTINVDNYPDVSELTFRYIEFVNLNNVNYCLVTYIKNNIESYALITGCSFIFDEGDEDYAVVNGGTLKFYTEGDVFTEIDG